MSNGSNPQLPPNARNPQTPAAPASPVVPNQQGVVQPSGPRQENHAPVRQNQTGPNVAMVVPNQPAMAQALADGQEPEPVEAQPVAKLPVCPNCGERTFPLSDPIIEGLSMVLDGSMPLARLGQNNIASLYHCGLLDESYQPTAQASRVVEHWRVMVEAENAASGQ